jgi:hypothetical protein
MKTMHLERSFLYLVLPFTAAVGCAHAAPYVKRSGLVAT